MIIRGKKTYTWKSSNVMLENPPNFYTIVAAEAAAAEVGDAGAAGAHADRGQREGEPLNSLSTKCLSWEIFH